MAGICSGNNFPNCTADYIIPDPDIAGIGVIISFALGNFLTVLLSLIALFFMRIDNLSGVDLAINKAFRWLNIRPPSTVLDDKTIGFWLNILEKVTIGLSDTQLLTGMAILIAGYLKCSISVYHVNVVSDLAWFASGAHLSTLGVLQVYLTKYPAIRLVRVILLLAMGGLLFSLVVYQGNRDWYLSPSTPAQCRFAETMRNIGGSPAIWMGFNIFFLVLGYGTAVISLYPEHTTQIPGSYVYRQIMDKVGRKSRQANKALIIFPKTVWNSEKLNGFLSVMTIVLGESALLICVLFLLVIWGIMFAFSLMIDSYAVKAVFDIAWFANGIYNIITDRNTGRDYMSEDDQSAEDQWGFGQLVPCLLLLLPLMTMFEVWYEAQAEAKEREAEERKHNIPLYDILHFSRPNTPIRAPELRLPTLTPEDRRRLAVEDDAFDENLVANLPLPVAAHRRSLSVDSVTSEDDRLQSRHVVSRSEEHLLPKSVEQSVRRGSQSVVSQDETPAVLTTES